MPALAIDSESIPANAIMPKPLPTLRNASLRVTGLGDLWLDIWLLVDKDKFGGTEKQLGVAAPNGWFVFDLFGLGGSAFMAGHTCHHSHSHGGVWIGGGHGFRCFIRHWGIAGGVCRFRGIGFRKSGLGG